MSYCSNCGSEIRIGKQFCNQCGYPISGIASVSPSVLQEQKRKENLEKIDDMIRYFSKKQDQFREVADIPYKIEDLGIAKIPVTVKEKRGDSSVVVGVIMLVFSILITLMVSCGIVGILQLFDSDITNEILTNEEAVLIIIAAIFAVVVVSAITLIITGAVKNKKYSKAYQKQRELAIKKRDTEITNLYFRLADLHNNLNAYYKAYDNCPVGFNSCHPETLNKIRRVITSGRADTIKEALNILAQDDHNKTMENLARDNANNSYAAARNAGAASRSAEAASKASRAVAFFSALTFLEMWKKGRRN